MYGRAVGLLALISTAGAAMAAPVWTVPGLITVGCNANETSFTTQVVGSLPTLHWRTIVGAGGLTYMDQDVGPISADGSYTWRLYGDNSAGPTSAAFPLPPDTPVIVDFELVDGKGGPLVFHRQVTLSRCNGGAIANDVVLAAGPAPAPVPAPAGATLALLAGLLAFAARRSLRKRTFNAA